MLKVYGASDDLIEIEGDIEEEFGHYQRDKDAFYLAFSDGTILSVLYDQNGIWRLTLIIKGSLYDRKEEGDVEADTNDVVYFNDGVKWCLLGNHLAK